MLSSHPQSSQELSYSMPATACSCSGEAWYFDWSQFPAVEETTSFGEEMRFISLQNTSINRSSPFASKEEAHPGLPQRCASDPALLFVTDDPKLPATLPRSASAPTHASKKHVSFDPIVTVRTHPVELADHPCCRGGMALQLSWRHEEPELVDLDIYESHSPKRRQEALRLDYSSRRERLTQCTGLTGAELLRLEYEMMCGKTMHALRVSSSSTTLQLS